MLTDAERKKDTAAHRRALRVFGKRAYSCRCGGSIRDYPAPTFSVGTSYVRDGAIHLVVKGAGKSWESAFRDAKKKEKPTRSCP